MVMAVMAVMMLFFIYVFQIIQQSIQLNKQLTVRLYSEVQVENAFAMISHDFNWAGSLSGNLYGSSLINGTRLSFNPSAITVSEEGKKLSLQYSQVERGILKNVASYPTFIESYASDFYTLNTLDATRSYVHYFSETSLRPSTQITGSTDDAKNWFLGLKTLGSTSPASIGYWDYEERGLNFGEAGILPVFYLTEIGPAVTPEPTFTYLLTIAYEIPESTPTFYGIDMGKPDRFYGEVIGKTEYYFQPDGGNAPHYRLVMEKTVPTVTPQSVTFRQTLLNNLSNPSFTVLYNGKNELTGVMLDFVYEIPDPVGKDTVKQYIKLPKHRAFWFFEGDRVNE
jgi:hypothetical protein